jgi:hypothetical protein
MFFKSASNLLSVCCAMSVCSLSVSAQGVQSQNLEALSISNFDRFLIDLGDQSYAVVQSSTLAFESDDQTSLEVNLVNTLMSQQSTGFQGFDALDTASNTALFGSTFSPGQISSSAFGAGHSLDMIDVFDKTEPLNVVPLPPAALAGIGLLAGLAGTRFLRSART